MRWPDSLAEGFPAPRDDEPESLRRDIADELADHLDCALRKQLLSTNDKELAHRKVLERFGDPRKVARQLWFDALKEKIMSQRIMLALASVMTLACLAAAGLVWYAIDSGSTAIAALVEQNRQASEAAQKVNQALLASLQSPSVATAGPQPLDLVLFRLHLVTGNKDVPLPPGFEATLTDGQSEPIKAKIGPDGVADFGLVAPGRSYALVVASPFGQNYHRHHMELRPGDRIDAELQCPTALPLKTDVYVWVDWPEDLRKKKLWVVASFIPISPLGEMTRDGAVWTMVPPAATEQMVAINPTSELLNFEGREFGFRDNLGMMNTGYPAPAHARNTGVGIRRWAAEGSTRRSWHSNWAPEGEIEFGIPNRVWKPRVQWAAVEYKLTSFAITDEPIASENPNVLFAKVLCAVNAEAFTRAMLSREEMDARVLQRLVSAPPQSFQAVTGTENHWPITLPEEALKVLREQLAEEESQVEKETE
ncbi:MAG: hypothetical protein WED34_19115 [Planctomycetales bacterium]